jgi:hypothetical protein
MLLFFGASSSGSLESESCFKAFILSLEEKALECTHRNPRGLL